MEKLGTWAWATYTACLAAIAAVWLIKDGWVPSLENSADHGWPLAHCAFLPAHPFTSQLTPLSAVCLSSARCCLQLDSGTLVSAPAPSFLLNYPLPPSPPARCSMDYWQGRRAPCGSSLLRRGPSTAEQELVGSKGSVAAVAGQPKPSSSALEVGKASGSAGEGVGSAV